MSVIPSQPHLVRPHLRQGVALLPATQPTMQWGKASLHSLVLAVLNCWRLPLKPHLVLLHLGQGGGPAARHKAHDAVGRQQGVLVGAWWLGGARRAVSRGQGAARPSVAAAKQIAAVEIGR